jgi:hypothetical protein
MRPQAPQLAVKVRFVSHPLVSLPSQFPKPALHIAATQRPLLHLAVALARLQRVPQVPQWVIEVRRSVSHPFVAMPSQSPKPSLQRSSLQIPFEQLGTALAKAQALPQRPQCRGLADVETSHPLARLPSQLPKPALHSLPQVPIEHVGALFG